VIKKTIFLLMFVFSGCMKKKEQEQVIKDRAEILSEEEVEEFPEAGQHKP